METKRLPLKSFSKDEITLLNHIYRLNSELFFEFNDNLCKILFQSEFHGTRLEYWIRLSMETCNSYINFSPSKYVIENTLAEVLGANFPFQEVPDQVRHAAVSVFVDKLLSKTKLRVNLSYKLVSSSEIHEINEKAAVKIPFNIVCNDHYPIALGTAYFNMECLKTVKKLLFVLSSNRTISFRNIPLHASLIIGTTIIKRSELNNLSHGDIILLDAYWPSQGYSKILVMFSENNALWASLENDLITIIGGKETEMMSEEQDVQFIAESEEEPLVKPDEIEITLLFEVGRKQIPIKDLGSIKPGYTFELETPVDKNVVIRANNKKIGIGELVQINDRIGVRVLELATDEPG